MEPRAEELLREMVACPELNWVIGLGKAVAEGKTDPATVKLSIKDGWATVNMAEWHCHLALTEVARVKFVEGETSRGKISRSVHFVNAAGDSLMRVYFSKLVDDAGAVDAEKLARFEALRTKFEQP
jgi:putative heme iron utilization protein